MREILKADYAPHFDEYGLMRPEGNCLLFTAQYACLLKRKGYMDPETRDALVFAVHDCQVDPPMGLYQRHPVAFVGDQEGPDDYIGLGAIVYACSVPSIAQEILDFGRCCHYRPFWPLKLKYYYPNHIPYQTAPNVCAWLGRFPAVIAHLQWAAGEVPSLWRRLWWAGTVALTGCFGPDYDKDGGQDAWILSFMLCEVAPDRVLERWAKGVFRKRLLKVWGDGGMRAVFARYFRDDRHPHAVHFVEV